MDVQRYRRWLLGGGVLLGCITLLWLLWATAPGRHPAALATPDVATSLPANEKLTAWQGDRDRRDQPADGASADALRVEQCARDYRAALGVKLQGLAERQDARSQLALALLAPSVLAHDQAGRIDTVTGNAYAAAIRLAPDDPLIAWLQARNCRTAAGCDRDAAVARLLRLAPDNAAAWLLAMDAARARADTAAMEQALARAAAADRHAVPFGHAALEVAAVLQDVPLPQGCSEVAEAQAQPATQADYIVVHASAVAAAQSVPLGGFADLCGARNGAVPAGARRAECMAVLARMAGSDTLLAQYIAVSWLVQYTADDPEGAHWRERLRNLHWLMTQGWSPPMTPAELIDGVWTQGEVPSLQARLLASGRWPAPRG